MKLVVLILVLSLCCAPAFAGQIYGTLRESDRPVGPNVKVEVACGNNNTQFNTSAAAVTDNNGVYRLFVKETGKCRIRAYYPNPTSIVEIDSYPNPAHYDLDLIRQPSGQYELRRR